LALRDEPNLAASLHPRRSLDQFFYSSLPNTDQRDNDQVVSKDTMASRGGAKMVMVDQLWLWVIEVHESGSNTRTPTLRNSAMFSCFPGKEQDTEDTENKDLPAIADLRQAIADSLESDPRARSPGHLAAVAIQRAVSLMLHVRNEPSLDFLNIFRAAIAELVCISILAPFSFTQHPDRSSFFPFYISDLGTDGGGRESPD